MPRFGKDKDARNEELDRQAAEEVERLTRRSGPPGIGGGGMGGGFGGGGAPQMPSPLEMMAAELADGPRPVQRGARAPRKAAARTQEAFTPMPSGEVGSSFGPGGLNPGPRGGGGGAPPPSFGGGSGDEYGGHVTGPSVYYNNPTEPDEEEEMSITELALMDHAAHTGHRPEDLVIQYDAGTAEEMRDNAMRQFYERQQARRPGGGTDNPFAPAGMRRGPATGGGGPVRRDDPAAAGGALAQRLANKRRREEEEARRARAAAEPAARVPTAAPAEARKEAEVDEGALARVLARRRRMLEVDAEPAPEPAAASGRRHAGAQTTGSPGLRAVPYRPDVDDRAVSDDAPSLEDMAAAVPTRRRTPARKAPAVKAPAAEKAAKAPAVKAPAAEKAAKAPAAKAPATKAAPAKKAAKGAPAKKAPAKATKGGASLAKAPAARPTGKAKTIFCIECGEKNPAIAKFCFSCGNRLAVPEA